MESAASHARLKCSYGLCQRSKICITVSFDFSIGSSLLRMKGNGLKQNIDVLSWVSKVIFSESTVQDLPLVQVCAHVAFAPPELMHLYLVVLQHLVAKQSAPLLMIM